MPYLASMVPAIVVGVFADVAFGYVMFVYGFNPGFVFFAGLITGLLVFYVPYLRVKDWRETEYAITNQRVFFDTMLGYAVVNLTDVREIYVKKSILDRVFGTGSVFVRYRDFNPVTRYWKPHGEVVVRQGPPSFRSIKEIHEVRRMLEEVARISR